jgi:hypothetical protein
MPMLGPNLRPLTDGMTLLQASMDAFGSRVTAAEATLANTVASLANGLTRVSALEAARAFVQDAPMTVATLLSTYPPAAGNVGKYARVTDLWGRVFGVMRCSFNGRVYWWAPTDSEEFAIQEATVPASGTLPALTTPPIIRYMGSGPGAGVTVNLTLGLVGAYPGLVKEISNGFGSAYLGALNILGTGLGSGIASLLGASKRFACVDDGSQLKWVQL